MEYPNYTVENSQPKKDGQPIRVSHLVDDINILIDKLKKKDLEIEKLLQEGDEGETL